MRQLCGLSLLLLAGTLFSGTSTAQEPSGNAIRVSPAVDARGPGGERLLQVEGAVFMGDELVTSPQGNAQIRFRDDTRLVVGPNSRLVIDTFVYSPTGTAQDVAIRMSKGVFRFISGNSPSSAYSIRTPTMTIGVRGTILDVYAAVNADESGVIFHEGGGAICDAVGSNCIAATADCRLFVAPRDGAIMEATGLERQIRMLVRFPFAGSGQGNLDAAFQTMNSSCNDATNARSNTREFNRDTIRPRGRPEPEPEPCNHCNGGENGGRHNGGGHQNGGGYGNGGGHNGGYGNGGGYGDDT
jgi:hypothetical protein